MTHTLLLLPVVLQIVKVSVLIIVTEQMVPLLGNSVTNQTFHLQLTVKENKMNIIFPFSLSSTGPPSSLLRSIDIFNY